jgi:molybdate transport system substrate-binding protein
MKMLAAIVGTAVILSPPLYAQFTGAKVADAKPGDVRVMATAAIREPLNAVLKQAETAIDKPILAEYGSARGNLKDQILKGQDFEVAMLLPDVDDEIQAAGKIVPGRFEIARVPVALACAAKRPVLMSAPRLRSKSRC